MKLVTWNTGGAGYQAMAHTKRGAAYVELVVDTLKVMAELPNRRLKQKHHCLQYASLFLFARVSLTTREEVDVMVLQETPKSLAEQLRVMLGEGWACAASSSNLQVHFKTATFGLADENVRWCFPDLDYVNPYKSWRRFHEVYRAMAALASSQGNV